LSPEVALEKIRFLLSALFTPCVAVLVQLGLVEYVAFEGAYRATVIKVYALVLRIVAGQVSVVVETPRTAGTAFDAPNVPAVVVTRDMVVPLTVTASVPAVEGQVADPAV
jgi:hypothetical protein